MSFLYGFLLIGVLFVSLAQASGPKTVHISGRILDNNTDLPLTAASVDFKVKVLSPNNCLLYEEQHLGKDLSDSDGVFSLSVGSGAAAVNVYATAGQEQTRENILKVFSNHTATLSGLQSEDQGSESTVCNGTYTPAAGDLRKVKIVFNTGSGGPRTILPYHQIGTVPYSMVAQEAAKARDAEKLGGLAAADYAKLSDLNAEVPNHETDPSVQAFAKSALPNCGAGQVLKADGTSFSCVADTGGAVAVATTTSTGIVQIGSGLAVTVGGVVSVGALPLSQITGLTAALDDLLPMDSLLQCSTSQVLIWQSANDTFVCSNISIQASQMSDFNTAVDARITLADGGAPKLPLAGGTMLGDLNMGSKDVLAAGHITMSSGKTLLLGNLSQVQENALVLTAGHKGLSWYNTDMKAMRLYDGTAKLTVAASSSACSDGQILKWNDTGKTWDCAPDASGGAAPGDATYATKGILRFDSSADTSGITISSGVASVNTGTGANQIVKLGADSKLPAVDGSALTNLSASNLASGSISTSVLPTIPVTKGGTGLTAGTSGGIPYFNSGTTMASSAALVQNGVVLGGGAGAAPVTTAAGTGYQILRVPAGGGAPEFGSIDLSSAVVVGTSSLALANGGTGATSASGARTALGLGTAALATTGSASGNVPVLGVSGMAANKMCTSDGTGAGIICNVNIPGTNTLMGSLTMLGNTGCMWQHANTSFASYTNVAACNAATVTGLASVPAEGKIPGIRFANLPAGDYEITVLLFSLYAVDSGVYCRYRIWDGTNFSGLVGSYEDEVYQMTGLFSYATDQTNITFYIQAQTATNGKHCRADLSVPGQDKMQIYLKKL